MLYLRYFTQLGTLILILASIACGVPKITEENYQRIQTGMTMAEVTAILGEPTDSKSAGIGDLSATTANWKGEITIHLQFLNGKVRLKSMNTPLTLPTTENGKPLKQN